jgi:hypothetical protein
MLRPLYLPYPTHTSGCDIFVSKRLLVDCSVLTAIIPRQGPVVTQPLMALWCYHIPTRASGYPASDGAVVLSYPDKGQRLLSL